ncbi:MAG: hypothetical protein AB1726_05115 [Planctomycetota bacterium]
MRPLATLALLPALAVAAAPPPQEAASAAPATTSPVRQDYTDAIPLDGRLVPADFAEISFWPEAYSGELLFLDVAAHGAYVNAGDVIARFETKSIDREIENAERDLVTTGIQHEGTVARAAIAEEAGRDQLEDAVFALESAQRSLDGWQKHELEFHARQNDLSRQRYQYGIEDQEDELAQLEAMYRDDELVDATEEIVLKRSRRELASSRVGQKLSLDRMTYEDEYQLVETGQRKLRAVEDQKAGLDRLVRSQEIERRERENGVVRSEAGLAEKVERLEGLRRDREHLTVRAPRAGIVLHGGAASQRPGQSHPVHERGGHGGFRTPLFCVADPDRLAVALSVPESKLSRVRENMPAKVTTLVTGDTVAMGTLHVERYPTAGSAHAPEGAYDGDVRLDGELHGVVAGMRAKVELVVETLEDVLMLPSAAVFRTDAGACCWAVGAGGELAKVPLTLGPASGELVVVYGDLDENTRVSLEEPKK